VDVPDTGRGIAFRFSTRAGATARGVTPCGRRCAIAGEEPDTWFLNAGRVAALAHLRGHEPRTLMHERTDEDVLDRLSDQRVLKTTPRPS
jgi:hypothetical protein